MKKRRKFTRNGNVADTARLDFHDWFGSIMDRTRAKTSEKHKGLLMIDKIKSRFAINDFDLGMFRKQMKDREESDFKEMEEHARQFYKEEDRKLGKQELRPIRRDLEPLKLTRDERGQLISPFGIKAKQIKEEQIRKKEVENGKE